MINVVKNLSRFAFTMGAVTLLTIAAAEARPARNSELSPSDSAHVYQTASRAGMQSTARINTPQADEMCTASRMQVPEMDGSLVWKSIEDCNSD